MSTAAIVSIVFLAVLIAWVALVFAGLFQQLRGEIEADSKRRHGH